MTRFRGVAAVVGVALCWTAPVYAQNIEQDAIEDELDYSEVVVAVGTPRRAAHRHCVFGAGRRHHKRGVGEPRQRRHDQLAAHHDSVLPR